jgi:hypothetical protein
MQILAEQDDDADFIARVEHLVEGLLRRNEPQSVVLIKIDNWFGSRWLSFSGKAVGALGVWKKTLIVPPFVPNRVVSQRRFAAPLYVETDPAKPLHLNISSSDALNRKVSEIEPGAVLIWYSGGSKPSGRGSVMAYVPEAESYWTWYAGWARRGPWHLEKTIGVRPQDLLQLMESA